MSTRIADIAEVGHGSDMVVLTILRRKAADVLTPSQAEQLAIVLIRQAGYARAAAAEGSPDA